MRARFGVPWYGRLWALVMLAVGLAITSFVPWPYATDALLSFPAPHKLHMTLTEHHWRHDPLTRQERYEDIQRVHVTFRPAGHRIAASYQPTLERGKLRPQALFTLGDPDERVAQARAATIAPCLDAATWSPQRCRSVKLWVGPEAPPLIPTGAAFGLLMILAGLGLLLSPSTMISLKDNMLELRTRWPWPRTSTLLLLTLGPDARLKVEAAPGGAQRLYLLRADGQRQNIIETHNRDAITRLLTAPA